MESHTLHTLCLTYAADGIVAMQAWHVEYNATAVLEEHTGHTFHFTIPLRIMGKVAEITLAAEQAMTILAMHTAQMQLGDNLGGLNA